VSLFTSTHGIPSLRNVPPAPQSDLDRYEENRIELHKVEAELGEAIARLRSWYAQHGPDKRVAVVDREVFCRVGALTATPQLSLLESNYRKVLQKRAALLSRHAELAKLAGKSK
jgi:hypothetical protein